MGAGMQTLAEHHADQSLAKLLIDISEGLH
jgi:hypothetical protein